jgi:hypothetical protein
LFFLAVVGVFSGCLPAFGLWLPWATEEQKVKKSLNDVWQALIANDRVVLKQRLDENGAGLFIQQEREKIRTLHIKSYESNIKSVKIDPTTRSWAFVEHETVANLRDGKKMVIGNLSILRKIGGEWKLLTGINKQSPADQGARKESPSASSDKAAFPKGVPPLRIPGTK